MDYKKIIITAVVILAIVFTGSTIVLTRDSKDVNIEPSGHGHDHSDEGKSSQVTVWGGRFEIFLEHPFVLAGTPADFVTHVTDRVTLEPRRKGPVIFVLTDESEKSTRHIERKPARDGIYIPELTFPKPGRWKLSLIIPLDEKEHIVELPAVTVYSTQDDIYHAPDPEEITGISFLKEQQWKIPFQTEAVKQQKVLSQEVIAVPESAVVDDEGKPVVFVQLGGETFQKRRLELGKKNNGLVQVLAGLSEGEYVTTKGASAVMEAEHELLHGDSIVHLSDEDIKKYGIEVERAGSGDFDVHISVPGEITFNENKLAHIVPTVPGIVRQVAKNVGDNVVAGEVIAWLESTKLGGAKVDYLAKQSEISCCSIEYVRAQDVYDNTIKLLEMLKSSPSLETLRNMNGSAMGMNRSLLVSSYAEYTFARETYLREKDLYEKKISSKEDFLKAESAFKKADAQYAAMRDSVNFEVYRGLQEARNAQNTREIELIAAEQLLYVLGLTTADVNDLAVLSKNWGAQIVEEEECNDPNCTECAAKSVAGGQGADVSNLAITNDKLAWYPIRSPFSGTIINKHITLGEVVKDDSEVFVVADLNTVWVNLQVHQKDIALIRKGQKVIISAKSSVPETKGVIRYVEPVVDGKTRISLARVVLDNRSRQLRPGTFITANVLIEKRKGKLVVAKDILQDVDDKTCLFIQDDHGFEARPVAIGRSNDKYVEILTGLRPGEKIVTKNSFRLKAELEKTAGGGHAGHGHVH
ncbi:MAG: efflux RND transporter periplasmic adaptor subunit [Planctomycetes bacterium]|nr:efflux RND transporter periplasmic adaptor subunit [Planctomycetota bacterium]